MNKKMLAIALAAGLLGATQVQAQGMTRDQHNAAEARIEADHKAAKAQCDTLKDNAKDVCEKQADGNQNVAKAELDQRYRPSDSNARKVAEAKVKAAYEVADEKCDDMSGDAKDACEKEAKAQEARGMADVKAMK